MPVRARVFVTGSQSDMTKWSSFQAQPISAGSWGLYYKKYGLAYDEICLFPIN